MEGGAEEVAQVTEEGEEITAKAQILKSLVGIPIINVLDVGGSSTPSFINNPPNPSFFEVNHLFPSPPPPSTFFFYQLLQ